MPAVDVLISPGEKSSAAGELTMMHPLRDRGEGRSPCAVDVRVKHLLRQDDGPALARLFPFAEQLMAPGAAALWDGVCVTKPSRISRLRLASLEGEEVIAGDATLHTARLIVEETHRWLELTLRVGVSEDYEAPVHVLRQVVQVEVEGRPQSASSSSKKGK